MKTKGSGTFEYETLCAIRLLFYESDTLISLDSEYSDVEQEEVIDPILLEVSTSQCIPNPEQELILKEAFENLSDDSKDLLAIIIHWPDELDEMIGYDLTPRRGRPNYFKIRRGLLRIFRARGCRVARMLRELSDFTKIYFEIESAVN